VDVLEDDDERLLLSQRLEQLPHRQEDLFFGCRHLREAERPSSAPRQPLALALVRERRGDAVRTQLFADLDEWPVRDSLSVREAAADEDARAAVEAGDELMCEPGFPDSRGTEDREQVGGAPFGGLIERVPELAKLALPADERRVVTGLR
jgi:hypothetical protein